MKETYQRLNKFKFNSILRKHRTGRPTDIGTYGEAAPLNIHDACHLYLFQSESLGSLSREVPSKMTEGSKDKRKDMRFDISFLGTVLHV